ncbi:hypothetical protein DOI34_26650 [Salmonella enterica subsp. enterica serovar Virchow]|nr:hypothetical protein [Salmonella enterica subsp. enterica serovar Virchow]
MFGCAGLADETPFHAQLLLERTRRQPEDARKAQRIGRAVAPEGRKSFVAADKIQRIGFGPA